MSTVCDVPQGHVFVKIDFTNANTLRRDAILEAVQRHIPDLLPYASASYSGYSDLQFGEFCCSHRRAQQGFQLGDALLLPGRSRSANIAAIADCRWLSGRHVYGGLGRHGGGGLHSAGVGRSRSSRPHTQPIQVWGRSVCSPM